MGKVNGKAVLLVVGVIVGLIGGALAGGWLKLPEIRSLSKPVGYVRITGEFQQLGKEELKTLLLPLVTTGFFEADMQAVQQTVANMPWVKNVAVRRVWPDTIDIAVQEKIPQVRWGERSLMTAEGVVFTPNSLDGFEQLVKLEAPVQQRLKVLEIMQDIKTVLAGKSFGLAEFLVNGRQSWTVKLTSGLVILLGREGQLDKLQRFLRTLPLLRSEQIEAMAQVDLRYPNGYAVAWKPDTPEFDWANMADPEQTKNAKAQ